jgi:hypothetical protein
MKNSIRIAMAAGLFAGMVVSQAPLLADEASDHDLRVEMEAIKEEINGLKASRFDMGNMAMEGFADIRYDDNKSFAAGTNNLSGLSGFYARRAEIKMSGYLGSQVIYSLGFDFTELKHKDLGIEVLDVPLLLVPVLDLPDYAWSIKVGQYRQPFGISPQTSSSAIWFAERPMWNGGKNFTGGAKLVSERVMGIQARQKVKYSGILNYDLQVGMFNNASDDQAAGKNSIGAGTAVGVTTNVVSFGNFDNFRAQTTDEALSTIARLAIGWDFLNGLLPEKSKVQTGVSYIYDSKNTVWSATTDASRRNSEVVGAELLVQLGTQLGWQTEWVSVNNGFGMGVTPTHVEGWNSDVAVDILPWVSSSLEPGDKFELLFRLDEESSYPLAGAQRVDRIGGGLKWSYLGGKTHTAINYFVDAPEQMFGGDSRSAALAKAPNSYLVIQQQFAFETGKPKPRVKDFE